MSGQEKLLNAGGRITVIDALRGFALLGVVLVHMNQHYSNFTWGMSPREPLLSGLDSFVGWLVPNVLMGRFINIFAFLFGMSFFIQMDRAAKRGVDFRARFVWRMVVLFIIGMVGSAFYSGDILSLYAIYGVIMVLLYKCKNWVLMLMALFLLGGGPKLAMMQYNKMSVTEESQPMPTFNMPMPRGQGEEVSAGEALSMPNGEFGVANGEDLGTRDIPHAPRQVDNMPSQMHSDQETPNQQSAAAPPFRPGGGGFGGHMQQMENPSFWSAAKQNLMSGFAGKIGYQFVMSNRGFITLALFILGFVVGRLRFFETAHLRRRNYILLALFVAGFIAINWVVTLFPQQHGFMMFAPPTFSSIMRSALSDVSTVLFSAILTVAFVVLYELPVVGKCLSVLAPYGRMGLTNYVSQSVIGAILFASWAFGATFGGWSATETFLLGLGVYIMQIAFSALWLKYFKYGPLEWFWRTATYMKIQPFKR